MIQNPVSDGSRIASPIAKEATEPVQVVAEDCCLVVVDTVGPAQEVAGHCCFIDEDADPAQETPGIHCLPVESFGDLQGYPLGWVDDALDMTRCTSSLPSAFIDFVCIDS